ncbi:uncharacterized protein LY89DRAFT_688983 [Mollisia scopiformis]|uniref:Uncharacterized protein n=1 Tax=Mollisia scopiformis TaxID=149040 RepID=A0A194WSU3_MOLSC|nr:uncharacterized protein LY89DRAFT_688983 [Mollisia scopiformis]KUJ11021.1 hypothetical protein LY89DRAFT_688983 [Mollisia scopiformis]
MNQSDSVDSNPILLGGYNFGFDQNSTNLTGSHFKDHILVSAIAVNGLCVVAFLALAIVTCCMKLSWRAKGRKVFAVLYGLVVAMSLAYGRTLADEIIHEFGLSSVVGPYLALPILKQVFANATDTILIFVLYSIIRNRSKHLRPGTQDHAHAHRIHMGTWLLIFLLGIADESLFFYAQAYVESDDIDPAKALNIVNWYKNIHLSYVIIYCTIILEIFACSVRIWHEARQKQAQSPISNILVQVIAPFLVIRSISNVALSVIYITLGRKEEKSTAVVVGILLGLTSVVVYVGLVVIAFEKDWDVPKVPTIARFVDTAHHLDNEADGKLFP